MAPEEHPSPLRRMLALTKRRTINGVLRVLPDEINIQLQYWRAFKRFANLKAPARFTEKVQWLKLHGGLQAHTDWVDKVIAKERVAAILGEQWITPTLWSGKTLPPRAERTWPLPYVIKASHGSGFYHHMVTEADKDWTAIEKTTDRWLRQRWHPHLLERQYDAIVPQLLVEPRLGGTAEVIPYDYKFYVFNGRVAYVGVSIGRLQGLTMSALDRNWAPLSFTHDETPRASFVPEKPPHFDEMLAGAETLAKPFVFARIDFYDLPEGPRFGEITLTPASGHGGFTPDAQDFESGALMDLTPLGYSAAIKSPSDRAFSRA